MVDAEKAAEELEDGKQKNLRGEQVSLARRSWCCIEAYTDADTQGTVHEHAPG